MLEFTLDVSSLAFEFTLGCAYLSFCRGSGAWIIYAIGRSLTIILIMLLADFTTPQGANFKQRIGQKKIFIPDNIKNNILSHCPALPVRRDMRTSGNKMNTSIENSDFQTVPGKDIIHPGNNEYFHYPFRMNKQGKHCRETVSLIKE